MCRRRPLLRAALAASAAPSASLPVVVLAGAAPSTGARGTIHGPYVHESRGRAALLSSRSTDPVGRRFL